MRVEQGARRGPESQNFDGEVLRQGNMADSHAATGDACGDHLRHSLHCPPEVANSAAVAGVKLRFFERQGILSEWTESKERLDAMADVIAGVRGPFHPRLPRLPPPHLHFPPIHPRHPRHPLAHQFRIHLRNFHRGLGRYRFAAEE